VYHPCVQSAAVSGEAPIAARCNRYRPPIWSAVAGVEAHPNRNRISVLQIEIEPPLHLTVSAAPRRGVPGEPLESVKSKPLRHHSEPTRRTALRNSTVSPPTWFVEASAVATPALIGVPLLARWQKIGTLSWRGIDPWQGTSFGPSMVSASTIRSAGVSGDVATHPVSSPHQQNPVFEHFCFPRCHAGACGIGQNGPHKACNP